MDEERDRFLTEAMGWCWHDFDPDKPVNTYSLEAYVCNKCKGFILGNNDFSQEEDFSRLLSWVRKQDHLRDFLIHFHEGDFADRDKGSSARERFATQLYRLLRGKSEG
ncbi:MAG TPA: hypothetical protein VMT62_10250 [Syntrophorhabdaceae bacterium]|nr:hypothetical protein [Syntrophorhabdaceae bacterium]